MHVFRHSPDTTSVGVLWQQCERALTASVSPSPAALFPLLHAFARLECGLADLENPNEDEWVPQIFPFQEASLLACRAYLQPGATIPLRELCRRLPRLRALLPPLDRLIALSTWEGFRYYALFPERYTDAAGRWRRGHPRSSAWVIGLRSMGSALGAVVAAHLLQTEATIRYSTLRPRGEPDRRCCRTGPRLRKEMRDWPGDFLLVDEGPGLSGSSLGGTALLLESLGIASSRIALMPSWDAPVDHFHQAPLSAVWQRLQRYPASPLTPPEDAVTDLSAGGWRTVFPGRKTCVTWPQHERAKFLSSQGGFIKFAGLGPAADAAIDRARELAAAGFAPAVLEASAGWIRYPVLRSRPFRPHSPLPAWSEAAGNYMAFLASRFRLGARQPPHAQLLEMVDVNLRELLGLVPLPEAPEGVPVALDARMQPQEWGWTDGRWIKFDGIDHHDDPFFPGPCDIAWDLAAVEIEYGLALGQAVLNVYQRRSGDRHVTHRLPWYRIAYCAFRTAYSRLAATQTIDPDASRWRALATRYEHGLRSGLVSVA